MKIDAVITWVDGNDPQHIAKRQQYGDTKILNRDDVAGSTRYTSVDEIFYCVASLNKYAPWLNKIYIVTDNQDPMVGDFIQKHFPEGSIPVEIVDHKVIFKGYEEYIPTFNSISIESMTWRIPGLSEHFIEFNDDLILAAPTKPEDFFPREGEVVCYGKAYSTLYITLSHLFRRHRDGSKQVSFRQTMVNAAKLLGYKKSFIKIYHTPKALLRSVYEKFFTEHPDLLIQNISHRFRHYSQYNPEELQYLILRKEGRATMYKKYNLLYLKPTQDLEYIDKKLAYFDYKPETLFGCFNSLDQMTEEGRAKTIEWISKRIGLKE